MNTPSDTIKYALYEVFTDPDILALITKKLVPYLKEDDPSIPNPPKRATSNLSIKARFIAAFEDLRYNRRPSITTYSNLSEVGLMRIILNDVNLWRKALNSVMYIRIIRRRFAAGPLKFNEHEGISEKILGLVKLLDKYQHNLSADADTTHQIIELDEYMKSLYLQTVDFYNACQSRNPDFRLRNPPTEPVHALLAREDTSDTPKPQNTATREKTPEEQERAHRRAIRLGLLPKEEVQDEEYEEWDPSPKPTPQPIPQPIPQQIHEQP